MHSIIIGVMVAERKEKKEKKKKRKIFDMYMPSGIKTTKQFNLLFFFVHLNTLER